MKYMFYPEIKIKLHHLTLNIQRKKATKTNFGRKERELKKKRQR